MPKKNGKKNNKYVKKYKYRQELQLAPEGGISLTCTRLSLDKKVKDKSAKAKREYV